MLSTKKPKLSITIPCYNEKETLPSSIIQISNLLEELIAQGIVSDSSFVLFVDDGSHDNTWEIISVAHKKNNLIRGIKLSKNVGHQKALLAGMLTIKDEVDCLITLDADFQDDIRIIPKMIEKYTAGSQIVYGIRSNRESDAFFKRITASIFYFLCDLLRMNIKPHHADYRLVGKNALDALQQYNESNIFLRGIFPKLGFQTSEVFYKRRNRMHGESKYPLRKMLSFAWEGITSFSVAPLRIAGILGVFTLIITFLVTIYTFIGVFSGKAVPGWASLMLITLFLGSVQLICVSFLGEYIGKIYIEVKQRPRYIIEEIL